MSIIIGIDAGIHSTKIVGLKNGTFTMEPLSVKSEDYLSSIYGALGKFIHMHEIKLEEIEQINLTGVGSLAMDAPPFNLPTLRVDEFIANGLGARFASGLDHMIVVSMGTGTSLVRVEGDEIKHIGGLGLGGGTLQGLSKLMLNISDVEELGNKSFLGIPELVTLQVRDVCQQEIAGLPSDATVSLFGKDSGVEPGKADIAIGLIQMVFETIGCCAVHSQNNGGMKDFVLIGGLTRLEQGIEVFNKLEEIYGVKFHLPDYAPYCTALGAALSSKYEN